MKTLALQGIEPNGGGALSSNVSKLGSKEVRKKLRNFSLAIKKACHCEDERSEDVAIAKSLNINEITTQSSIARNDKSSSETNLTTYRLNDLTSFLDMFFSRFTSHFSRKRVAFTLAEVLITLGIIGVVSALTIPTIVTKYQKKLAVEQLKTTYSTLYNAFSMAVVDHGEIDDWIMQHDDDTPQSSMDFLKTYIEPYVKNVEVYQSENLKNCKNVTYRKMDGSIKTCDSVSGFCGTCGSGIVSANNNIAQIHNVNGSIIAVLARHEEFVEIDIDINGYKGPNVWGKDVFRFDLWKPSEAKRQCMLHEMAIPFGTICHTRDYTMSRNCNESDQLRCGEIIVHDGWQMLSDYPWR